ncbi:hypothetical protein AX17_005820 [Amanita inopinata Kibby_2008]|nr:hypothetical protein AX17_005820 [Amanita inopinata Kibby_2008]
MSFLLPLSPQLVKIPCIMVAMVGLQIATTPPHPPPSETEAAKSTRLEVVLKQRVGQTAVKAICWTAALAETAVIVANHAYRWSLSRPILSSLVLTNGPDCIRPTPLFFLGTFLTGLGGYIRYKCYKEMGKMFTFEMSIRQDHQLVTSGPYGVVRHPGYTGVLCTVTGIILWHLSAGSWARECGALWSKPGQVAFWTYSALVSTICGGLISRMFKEDEALHGTFGETWETWALNVPYKLVPGVY